MYLPLHMNKMKLKEGGRFKNDANTILQMSILDKLPKKSIENFINL